MANKLINLMINEISIVDDPANPAAVVSLWKRNQPVEKETPNMEKKDTPNAKGVIKAALANLFKSIDALPDENNDADQSKANAETDTQEPENTTPAPEQPADETPEPANDELAKAFQKAAEAAMSEEHKAFYDTLQGADKAEFVARDDAGRQEYLLGKRAPDAEKEALIAKVAQLEAEKAAAQEQAQTGEFLAKAKAEYSHVAGTDAEKAELLKFVETSIAKTSANMAALIGKIMKQAQANIAAATQENGHADESADTLLSDEADAKKAYEKSLKNIIDKEQCTRTQAIKKLKATPEGMAIYSKSLTPTT